MMARRRWGRFACLAVLVAMSVVLSLRAQAGEAAPPERIEQLIKQLDDASYPKREAASKELEAMGDVACPPLRRALAAGGLSLEAAARIKAVLDSVFVPSHGVVWRPGEGDESPAGLKSGDVILQANDRDVWSREDLLEAVWPVVEVRKRVRNPNGALTTSEYNSELTVWRKGQGNLPVDATLTEAALARTWALPDELSLYERHGRAGSWQADVRRAIASARGSQAQKQFAAAWKAGCRDAVVLKAWLAALLEVGNYAEAVRLGGAEAGNAQPNCPDGLVLYGLLPREIARAQLLVGRRVEALATLDAAASKAAAAKAERALAVLDGARMAALAAGSPEAAMGFARSRQGQMDAAMLPPGQVRQAAEALSAAGDPNDVLAFLDLVKLSPVEPGLRKAYEAQAPLAARYKARKDARGTPVPVGGSPGPYGLDQSGGTSTMITELGNAPVPGRLSCDLKLEAWPESRGRYGRIGLAVGRPGQRMRDTLAEIWLDRFGRVCMRSTSNPAGTVSTALAGAPNEWHRATIELNADRVRFWIDGRLLRTWYGPLPGGLEEVSLHATAVDARGTVCNIRHHILTAAEVDAAEIEGAMAAMLRATTEGDLQTASENHRKLQAIWAKVPEAKNYAEASRLRMGLYERLLSPEGLRLATKEVLNWPTARTEGKWELEGEWLVGTPARDRGPVTFELPLLTGDIEITGVLDAEGGDEPCELLILYDGRSVGYATSQHPPACHLKYLPPFAKIYVGAWWDREKGKVLPGQTPLGPTPFCLRLRGEKAALFAQKGDKPLFVFSGPARQPQSFKLWSLPGERAKAKYGKLVIRPLPKDKALESPAELPSIGDAQQPTTAPAE